MHKAKILRPFLNNLRVRRNLRFGIIKSLYEGEVQHEKKIIKNMCYKNIKKIKKNFNSKKCY